MNKYEGNSKTLMWFVALALTGVVAGCGGGGDGGGGSGAGASPIGTVCTGTAAACVSLGSAGNLGAASGYAILAKTGVSTVPSSAVTGNIGLSPAARGALTGWSETSDVTDTFSTSPQVAGKLYADDYVGGTTKVDLGTAVGSMETAYTEAAGKPAGVGPNLNLGGGTVTGQTLAPGTYTWGTAVIIPTDLTLNGSATDVWIFQIAGTLDMAANRKVILAGGALPQNIFWQVSGAVTMGAGTHFEGIILSQTGITFGNLSSINGRLLAQSAVVLDMTTITVPQ